MLITSECNGLRSVIGGGCRYTCFSKVFKALNTDYIKVKVPYMYLMDGRTAPRTAAMDTLGEWEHNNNMYLAAVGTVGIRSTQHMKGGANPFSFSALCYLDSNQIPIHCWDDRDFQSPDGDP